MFLVIYWFFIINTFCDQDLSNKYNLLANKLNDPIFGSLFIFSFFFYQVGTEFKTVLHTSSRLIKK